MIIFNSLFLEYFQQIDDKSDLKIINKFNFGIEFYSNGICTDIKNIIKSYMITIVLFLKELIMRYIIKKLLF